MKRYFKLYLHFLRFSFSKAMHFRFDFFFRTIMDLIYYSAIIIFYQIIYSNTKYFAGWDSVQIQVFLATYFFIDAVDMTFFATNLWWLPISINKGDLDHYLTKPVSPLFFFSLKEFAANSFLNVIFAFFFLLYSISHITLEPLHVLLYIIFVILGIIIHYSLHLLFILPVFWTGSPRGLDELYVSTGRFLQNPTQIYGKYLRFFFTFIFPLGLIISVPAQTLMDPLQWDKVLWSFYFGLFIILIVFWLWQKAIKAYQSASS